MSTIASIDRTNKFELIAAQARTAWPAAAIDKARIGAN
jgi:hypothetical protein